MMRRDYSFQPATLGACSRRILSSCRLAKGDEIGRGRPGGSRGRSGMRETMHTMQRVGRVLVTLQLDHQPII
jgi:hypothetical protein